MLIVVSYLDATTSCPIVGTPKAFSVFVCLFVFGGGLIQLVFFFILFSHHNDKNSY